MDEFFEPAIMLSMKNKIKYNTLAIGITGGIGSGKSGVSKIFQSQGFKIIHADTVAKQLIESSAKIRNEIRRLFGKDAILTDDRLDRKKIADVVFKDPACKDSLNDIIHPPVLDYIRNEIDRAKLLGTSPMMVVEAALIFEAGSEDMYDYVIVIDADEETRIRRIMIRDNCTREDVLNRINSQMSPVKKIELADFVIDNSGDKKSLEQKTLFLCNLLKSIASTNAKPGG